MTKFFKKSVACMIAVLMIVSSLPFTAITANAATTTATTKASAYGVIKGSSQGRFSDPVLKICNDAQDGNYTIGFVNFNIDGISCTDSDTVTASYSFSSAMASGCTDNKGISVYYPTANYSDFAQSTGEYQLSNINSTSSTAIFKGNNSGHLANTITRYSMQKLGDFTIGSTNTVDIGAAIKSAKTKGSSIATICFVLTSAGGSGETNGWSDTEVTVNKNDVTVTVSNDKVVNDFVVKEATAYGTFVNDSDYNTEAYYKQIYKNVLYSPTSMSECYTSSAVSAEGKDKIYVTGRLFYGNTVLLYNGGTTPSMGVGFAVVGYSKPWNYNYNNVRVYRCNLTGTTQGIILRDAKWHGKDSRMNYTYNMFGQSEVIGTTSETECVQGEKGYYGNVLQYTGGDFTDDYKAINLTFQYVVGTDEGSKQTHSTGEISNATIYVLNYKKLVDKANTVNTEIAAMDPSIYEENSLNAYYTAVNNMFAFNPSSYDYSSDQAATVKKAAQDMNSLMTAVDTAKSNLKINYTFIKVDDSSTVIAAKNDSEALSSAPTNTTQKVVANNNSTHTVTTYSWPTTATNYVFKETATTTTVNCSGGTATCTKKAVCSTCNAEYGDLLEHKYTYTTIDTTNHIKKCTVGGEEVTEAHTKGTDGKCTLCGQSLLDYTAFDAANTEAGNIIAQHTVSGFTLYTTESYAEYNKIVVDARAKRDTVTTQEEINELTSILLSAETILRKNSCTVKVYVIPEDGTGATDAAKTYTSTYGSQLELDLAAIDSTAGGVKAWIVKTDDGVTQTKILTADTKITLYVTKDATVDVYTVANPNTEADKYSKVTFLGKNGSVVAVKYVKEDETLNTEDVDIPSVPFYTSTSWDKASVTGTGSDIYVRAQYTYSTEATKCNVNLVKDGAITWTKEYSYDSYVYLDEADKTKQYALASDKEGTKILTYLDGIEFYAPKTAEIYVVEVTSKEAKIAITGNFKEELTESEVEKVAASFNCKFYLPEDCEVIEWGAEISSGTAKKVVKGEKISQGNEYTIRMKVKKTLVTGGTVTSFTGKAYLIYKDSTGTTHTIYSDEVTQSLV